MARIHALASRWRAESGEWSGTTIGLMWSRLRAAIARRSEKLGLWDGFLPGVAGWGSRYKQSEHRHFRVLTVRRQKPWLRAMRKFILLISGNDYRGG